MSYKVSYGVACCRVKNNIPEILLVKKRVTYAFMDFIQANFTMNNLPNMLDKMTLEEKKILKSCDFDWWWWWGWLEKGNDSFYQKRKLFFNTFNYTKLIELVNKSKTHYPENEMWEIPKGRKETGETDIGCAVREFTEETGVSKLDIHLLNSYKNYSFTDNNIKYYYKYFLATSLSSRIVPMLDITNHLQSQEIAAIKWFTLDEIKGMSFKFYELCYKIIEWTVMNKKKR